MSSACRDGDAGFRRSGQQCEAEGGSGGVGEVGQGERDKGAPGKGEDGGGRLDSRSEEIVRAVRVLSSVTDDEIAKAGLPDIAAMGVELHWSGMLPSPRDFNAYDPETRERMCRWNDAFTIDESRRQDKLVESEISQQNRGAWMTFILLVLFLAASFAAFIITRSVNSFWLLSVPALNIVSVLLKPLFSKSSRNK